jgi:hypothetical protein
MEQEIKKQKENYWKDIAIFLIGLFFGFVIQHFFFK